MKDYPHTWLVDYSRASADVPSDETADRAMGDSVTGIILAGATSRRMGADKSFLNLGGRPIIEHVIDIITESFSRFFIITNDPDKYSRFGVPTLPDVITRHRHTRRYSRRTAPYQG